MAFIPPMLAAVGSFLGPAFGVGTATTAAGVATGATTAGSVLGAAGTQAAIGAGTALASAKMMSPKMPASDTKKPIAMPDEEALKLNAQRQLSQRKGSRSSSILTTDKETKLG